MARAWFHSFNLPIIVTNCSNNYGPYQFPEKLIPLSIIKAINNQKIPLYGKGDNIRDWLFVEDHVDALILISERGNIGETYCIGANNEKSNKVILEKICLTLDRIKPLEIKYSSFIEFVEDRPGHDKRYAIDPSKIKKQLNWKPKYSFEEGLLKTIEWYINNLSWCKNVMENSGYSGERLGDIF